MSNKTDKDVYDKRVERETNRHSNVSTICRQKNLGTFVEFGDKSGIFVDKNKNYEHF